MAQSISCNHLTIKHIHSTALLCLIWALFSRSPQSSAEIFADDLDFAIHEVKYNYAGFPLMTEKELTEYEVMKAALRNSVDAETSLDYEAVGYYLAWFQNPHLPTACPTAASTRKASARTCGWISPILPSSPTISKRGCFG